MHFHYTPYSPRVQSPTITTIHMGWARDQLLVLMQRLLENVCASFPAPRWADRYMYITIAAPISISAQQLEEMADPCKYCVMLTVVVCATVVVITRSSCPAVSRVSINMHGQQLYSVRMHACGDSLRTPGRVLVRLFVACPGALRYSIVIDCCVLSDGATRCDYLNGEFNQRSGQVTFCEWAKAALTRQMRPLPYSVPFRESNAQHRVHATIWRHLFRPW